MRLDVFDAIELFGGYCRWWLQEEILARHLRQELQELPAPTLADLPTRPGGCWIVMVNPAQSDYPYLRPVFLVPLVWQRGGQQQESRLPSPLRQLAERIRQETRLTGWQLGFPDNQEFQNTDLRKLDDWTWDSGWAALTAGLLLADAGIRPKPQVWASAVLDSQGHLKPISNPREKIAYAQELGATHFFLPDTQLDTVQRDLPSGRISLASIDKRTETDKPASILKSYLQELRFKPSPTDSFEERRQFYMQPFQWNGEDRIEYYRSHLLNDVAQRVRDLLPPELQKGPTQLVSIVSGSPELVWLTAKAIQATQCLLLCTELPKAPDAIRCGFDDPSTVEFAKFPEDPDEEMIREMARLLNKFVQQGPQVSLVIDTTPGQKRMSWALQHIARERFPETFLINITSRSERKDGRNQPIPGTERPLCWQGKSRPFENISLSSNL